MKQWTWRHCLGMTLVAFANVCASGEGPTYEQAMAEFERGQYVSASEILDGLAADGNALAQCALAGLYLQGRGVPLDPKRAVGLYEQAASAGAACAYRPLSQIYFRGQGLESSSDRAKHWLKMSAVSGDRVSQYEYGLLYQRNVLGRTQDCSSARIWIEASALQAYPSAEAELGDMYAEGRCIERDMNEAARWTRRAAEQDDATAQLLLARLYLLGMGVEKSATTAYMWQRIAAPGERMETFTKALTPDERRLAERLAKDWIATRRGQ